MRLMVFVVTFALLAVVPDLWAESRVEPRPATVEDLDWMVGRWVGTGLGGEVEEVFMPAMGGAMPCAFRLVSDGQARFYEYMLYENTAEGVQIVMHHFSPGLKRWEDTPVTFDLVSMSKNAVLFSERGDNEENTRLRYEREGDAMFAELIEERDGKDVVTARFDYALVVDFK